MRQNLANEICMVGHRNWTFKGVEMHRAYHFRKRTECREGQIYVQCYKNSDQNPPIKSRLILMHHLKLLHNEEVFWLQNELNREMHLKKVFCDFKT